jgi:dTDP-glucose 4,6-dehydratase
MSKTFLVTGGAGFIGANFVLETRRRKTATVVNLDKLTYAGNLESLAGLREDGEHIFAQGDIGDREFVTSLLKEHRPAAVVNFAAESHVDRSIQGPAPFVETNIVGTFSLLEAAREYWNSLPDGAKDDFRFLHVSTDEVYGTLRPEDPPFTELTAYAPNSPYAASKASSDHLVRSYRETYGLPTLITNCSNNYGPFQFPEKLIPLMICNALEGKRLPIYGDGLQVRDWLYVADHCEAILTVLEKGAPGETYNVGGKAERGNMELVATLCNIMDELLPESPHRPHGRLITHVADRPGHDRRYAIDFRKIRSHLGWKPRESLQSGLEKTVRWYLEHRQWVEHVRSGSYREWIEANYGQRLGETVPARSGNS